MSLATSCSTCSTVFKVVEEQLKVSEGWVRCGHCHQVFNALEGLFDLDMRRSAQAPAQPVVPPSPPPPPNRLESAPASGADQARTVDGVEQLAPSGSSGQPMTGSTAASEQNWIETRPAMFSDIQALREQQRLRGLAAKGTPSDLTQAASVAMSNEVPAGAAATDGESLLPQSFESTDGPLTLDRAQQDPLATSDVHEASRTEPAPTPPAESQASESAPGSMHHRVVDLDLADTVFLVDDRDGFNAAELAWPAVPAWPAEPAETAAELEPASALDTSEDTASSFAQASGSRAEAVPAFLRGNRSALPSRRQRFAVGVARGLAAVVLIGQMGWQWRSQLASRVPLVGEALTALCAGLGCSVPSPRQLDALTLENTALTRPTGVDGFRLQVQLRNRAPFAVQSPHLELSLTDVAGSVIVRRVLTPADFQQTVSLGAESDNTWQLELVCADKRVSGYSVAAFYP